MSEKHEPKMRTEMALTFDVRSILGKDRMNDDAKLARNSTDANGMMLTFSPFALIIRL